MLPDEYWYGLCVDKGGDFPLSADSAFHWHATTQYSGNQESPFLVSNLGRYLWSETPYDVDAENGVLSITNGADDLALHEGDMLSMRGVGKGRLTGTGGTSRKGRLFVYAEIFK